MVKKATGHEDHARMYEDQHRYCGDGELAPWSITQTPTVTSGRPEWSFCDLGKIHFTGNHAGLGVIVHYPLFMTIMGNNFPDLFLISHFVTQG